MLKDLYHNAPPFRPADVIDYIFTNDPAKTTTVTTAPASIEDAAIQGCWTATIAPAGATSAATYTGLMRKVIADTAGGAWTGTSHAVGGYDYMLIQGNNNSTQQFIHESKLKVTGSGTHSKVVFYKPAIDTISGTVTNFILFDAECDVSGISGTVTNKYLIYGPLTDMLLMTKGGIEVNAKLVVDNYTLTKYDSGNRIMMFAGATKTITVPSTLPAGFYCRVIQGDANQVTIAASGGNSIFNYSSHTKTAGAFAVVDIDVITTGGSGASILSGNTGA